MAKEIEVTTKTLIRIGVPLYVLIGLLLSYDFIHRDLWGEPAFASYAEDPTLGLLFVFMAAFWPLIAILYLFAGIGALVS